MPFIVDASVTAAWLMPDENHPLATRTFELLADDHAAAPALWWFEVRNLLIVNERRGRLDSERTRRGLSLLGGLQIDLDRSPDEADILRLARVQRLTVYDAAYLELSLRLELPLATLDATLAGAARAEGAGLLEP
jgi:predicted nucleic acid-binding protein